jgi:hypothetical protein
MIRRGRMPSIKVQQASNDLSLSVGDKTASFVAYLAKHREFAYGTRFAAGVRPMCLVLIKSFQTGEVTAVEVRLLGKNNGAPEWWSVNGGESASCRRRSRR